MQAQQNLTYVLRLTLSSNESVAFKAPSGRPKGKQYLKKKKEEHKMIRIIKAAL